LPQLGFDRPTELIALQTIDVGEGVGGLAGQLARSQREYPGFRTESGGHPHQARVFVQRAFKRRQPFLSDRDRDVAAEFDVYLDDAGIHRRQRIPPDQRHHDADADRQ
jgi:hypothetical protein